MAERKRTKSAKTSIARLTMDAETLCAILARIVTRIVAEQRPSTALRMRPRKAKA